MRKLKKEKNKNLSLKNSENEVLEHSVQKQIKFILIMSWILPFFSLSFMHFARKTLHEKPKKILCKILNMEFSVILVLFILVSLLNTLALAKVSAYIIWFLIILIVGIFVFGVTSHIIGTLKWLKGEEYNFKFSAEFFKPYENINS